MDLGKTGGVRRAVHQPLVGAPADGLVQSCACWRPGPVKEFKRAHRPHSSSLGSLPGREDAQGVDGAPAMHFVQQPSPPLATRVGFTPVCTAGHQPCLQAAEREREEVRAPARGCAAGGLQTHAWLPASAVGRVWGRGLPVTAPRSSSTWWGSHAGCRQLRSPVQLQEQSDSGACPGAHLWALVLSCAKRCPERPVRLILAPLQRAQAAGPADMPPCSPV